MSHHIWQTLVLNLGWSWVGKERFQDWKILSFFLFILQLAFPEKRKLNRLVRNLPTSSREIRHNQSSLFDFFNVFSFCRVVLKSNFVFQIFFLHTRLAHTCVYIERRLTGDGKKEKKTCKGFAILTGLSTCYWTWPWKM